MTFLSRVWATLAECKSPADYYRLQIGIQQYATPDEVAMLAQAPIAWPPEFDAWLRGLLAAMTIERSDIQPYRLKPIGENVSLYVGPAAARILVVGFCGKAGLLFMPIPLVLQYFASGVFDVVVLRDPARMGFVRGISGYSASFHGVVETLRRDVDFSTYDEVRTFGTSGGGAAGLAGGVLLKAPHSVCFSGHLPSASKRYGTHPEAAAMEEILRCAAPLPNYVCVFGDANASDASRGRDFEQALRVRLLPVAGIPDHNVVFQLHRKRALLSLFRDVGLI